MLVSNPTKLYLCQIDGVRHIFTDNAPKPLCKNDLTPTDKLMEIVNWTIPSGTYCTSCHTAFLLKKLKRR